MRVKKHECMENVMNVKNMNVSLNNPGSPKCKVKIQNNKNPYSAEKSTSDDRPKCKAKFRVKQSYKGTFLLSPVKGSPVKLENLKKNIQPNKNSTVKTNLEFFRELEKSVKIPANTSLNMTPGKRKLVPVVEGVGTPISISLSETSLSTQRGVISPISESPAKRQRFCRHRGEGQ